MVGIMARHIYFLCVLLLFGCQTDISSEDQIVKGTSDLKTSDGVLDLSQFSQEQQKVEREQAAKLREELKAGRVVLEANRKEKIATKSVNLAVFARSVSNKLGEKIYYRNFISSNAGLGCKKFSNKNGDQKTTFIISTQMVMDLPANGIQQFIEKLTD
jgi:hypothetical protein